MLSFANSTNRKARLVFKCSSQFFQTFETSVGLVPAKVPAPQFEQPLEGREIMRQPSLGCTGSNENDEKQEGTER